MSHTPEGSKDVSAILTAWGKGDPEAGNQLIGIVYQELRRLVAHYLKGERGDHTLQPTALVHELYLKLFVTEGVLLNDREHFLAVAARQLRRIVVDYARGKNAQKRGGSQGAISLDEATGLAIPADGRVIELDQALGRLETLDSRAAQVVELRFFGGLTDDEVGKTLGISVATVKRDWDFARSWLLNQMG
jgi:RNA polymerase sigma factor (TIGR02999 family)